MSSDKRNPILVELAKHTGKRVSWQFIKKTPQFIPKSDYALSIVIRTSSPYEHKDEVLFLDDGRWLITYSPRTGGLQLADNRALLKCMDDHAPIGVFKQLTDKTDRRESSTYRILGLGLVTGYEASSDVFYIENVDRQAILEITDSLPDEVERYEIQLYTQTMNRFQPFVKEESITYTTTILKRDKAFRDIVVSEYDFTCAVCKTKFRLNDLVEATAAHIIPKHRNGSDDPRNGLALCRTHHWAFDSGIFTLNDNYEIRLSPDVVQADSHNFDLLEMEMKPLFLPRNETIYPHQEAIRWHRQNIWRK